MCVSVVEALEDGIAILPIHLIILSIFAIGRCLSQCGPRTSASLFLFQAYHNLYPTITTSIITTHLEPPRSQWAKLSAAAIRAQIDFHPHTGTRIHEPAPFSFMPRSSPDHDGRRALSSPIPFPRVLRANQSLFSVCSCIFRCPVPPPLGPGGIGMSTFSSPNQHVQLRFTA